jgi:hypothetical protein
MNKLLSIIFALLAFVVTSGMATTPAAEAARVAVLPLQVDNLVKDEEDTNDYSTYYWDVATDIFKFPAFDLLGDDEVAKILPAAGLKDFSEATLKDIANKAEADVVVAMRLDKLNSSGVPGIREETTATDFRGAFASYNRISGKYLYKDIYEKENTESVLLVRSNWRANLFSKITSMYMKRAIKLK